jgi:hypothetical protein
MEFEEIDELNDFISYQDENGDGWGDGWGDGRGDGKGDGGKRKVPTLYHIRLTGDGYGYGDYGDSYSNRLPECW